MMWSGGDNSGSSTSEGVVESASKSRRSNTSTNKMAGRVMHLLLRSKKMLILSFVYGVGNVLSYYALARVGE